METPKFKAGDRIRSKISASEDVREPSHHGAECMGSIHLRTREEDEEFLKFMEMFSNIAHVLVKKNHDYNHAFDKAYNRMGRMYAASKVYEKTERIITLTKTDAQVEEEGLADALMDNIGYCALYLNRISEKNKNI